MGGYAPVIRADHPAPPTGAGRTGRTARPEGSDGPPDDDMFVYRDPSARAGYLADQRAQEREAALVRRPLGRAWRLQREESRGPSANVALQRRPAASGPPSAIRAGRDDPGPRGPGRATGAWRGRRNAGRSLRTPARDLEQIKDFYLTAEAIGEENVDKHFDQLLAQQRELISEYFRQSAAARHSDGLPTQAAANPIEPRQPGGQAGQGGQLGTPEGAGVAAEPPRSW